METFKLGTAIGLNIKASFYADSANAAVWNKARLFFELVLFLLVMYSCRFMKSTRLESFQRDRGIYGKRVRFTSKASIGNIGVFSLIETGKEQYMCWRERPTLSLYPNAIGKTSLTCQTYLYDCMRTNIGRAVPRRTLGIVIAIICNIDK